jgi:hypothetical protein
VFLVGRSDRKEIDIKIGDMSVSRNQAAILVNIPEKKVVLKDLTSKFGTFVKVDGILSINAENY